MCPLPFPLRSSRSPFRGAVSTDAPGERARGAPLAHSARRSNRPASTASSSGGASGRRLTRQPARRSSRARRRGPATRRARRAASPGPISPRDRPAQILRIALWTSSIRRSFRKSTPSRSAGGIGAAGGRICASIGRSSRGLRRARAAAAPGFRHSVLKSGTRRCGLGMPGGRPFGLPESPLANRPRASLARGRAAAKKKSGLGD
jgi:hypothetical protein